MQHRDFILFAAVVFIISNITGSCSSDNDGDSTGDTANYTSGDADSDADSDADADSDNGWIFGDDCPTNQANYMCMDNCGWFDAEERDEYDCPGSQVCCEFTGGSDGDADTDADVPTDPCPTNSANYDCRSLGDCTAAGGVADWDYTCEGNTNFCCDLTNAGGDGDADTDADADDCPTDEAGIDCLSVGDCNDANGDFLTQYDCPATGEYCCQTAGGDGDTDADTDGDTDTDVDGDTDTDVDGDTDTDVDGDTDTDVDGDTDTDVDGDTDTDVDGDTDTDVDVDGGDDTGEGPDTSDISDGGDDTGEGGDTATDTGPGDTETDTGTGAEDTGNDTDTGADNRPICAVDEFDFLSCVPAGDCTADGIDPDQRCENAAEVCCIGPTACPTEDETIACLPSVAVCEALEGADISEDYFCPESQVCCQGPAK